MDLTSPDAWFFLPNIRPSVVASSYLGQFKINGTAAVSGDNVQIVQYADGSVLIPHPGDIKPLEVFAEPHFVGDSTTLGLYTYHNARSLAAYEDRISSFKLKRGYMATLAENANGTGFSKVFAAPDADLDVSVLPGSLNDSVSFIRVFPWRWTGRKGDRPIPV